MNHSESEFDAVADMQVRYEEALKAAENMPLMKFGLALERARARRATHPDTSREVLARGAGCHAGDQRT